MKQLVFFLEEQSAEALIKTLMPRLLPATPFRCIVFEGKQDLEKQLVRRMRGYCVPNVRFLVLRDQDEGLCLHIKNTLREKCTEAGHPNAVIRIACRELESWYLADLGAVEKGLALNNLSRLQEKAGYRSPDSTASPSRRLAEIAPSYQKIEGSRAISPHLNLENIRSTNFSHFIRAILQLGKS